MMLRLKKLKAIKVVEVKSFDNLHAVDAKRIFESYNTQVIHMALKPDQSLKKHTTPVNVFFYILEGKGVVEIGDEQLEVEKDMIIDSPKEIPHLLRNTGQGIFRFLVVKLP